MGRDLGRARGDETRSGIWSDWVVGVDQDVSGALALLKTDQLGCSAQIFDAPRLKVVVGKRIRRRLDAKSIDQLVMSFQAPIGTIAYIEQSMPFPKDGKQGWWCGGFNYGIWIGVLVASGFSVVPVPSALWKNSFEVTGSGTSKTLVNVLFDRMKSGSLHLHCSHLLSPMLKRKRDHGRAEALLIAAYGKDATKKADPFFASHKLVSLDLLVSAA
ncbi:Holliday junction resolvase MOC1, chloroplastic-like protein [Drosera capensis]